MHWDKGRGIPDEEPMWTKVQKGKITVRCEEWQETLCGLREPQEWEETCRVRLQNQTEKFKGILG